MADQSDLKLRRRVAPSLFYKIDAPEANHNPGPDRSPVAYTHESCLERYIASINKHLCVAPGRSLGTLVHFSHFQLLHFEKYLAIKSTKKLEN
jgi:hypothetical protein